MQGPTTKDRIGNYDGQGEGRIPERQLCRRVPKEQGLYCHPGTYGEHHGALLEDGNVKSAEILFKYGEKN